MMTSAPNAVPKVLLVVAVLSVSLSATTQGPGSPSATTAVDHRVLATNKTSTMQKEMQEAGDAGYEYLGQTVFKSAFGGSEVVVILERERTSPSNTRYEYRLLATKKTATLQKELSDAGAHGYSFVGMTVADTAMGGTEVVAILRRRTAR